MAKTLKTRSENFHSLTVTCDCNWEKPSYICILKFRVFLATPIPHVPTSDQQWHKRQLRRRNPPLQLPRSLYCSFSSLLSSFNSSSRTSSQKHGFGDTKESGSTRRIGRPYSYLLSFGFSLTQTPPLHLTETQLAQYNGLDPTKPIYLAIEYSLETWLSDRQWGRV